MTPKVSIGLPVYNGEQYIRQALKSLMTQDFKDFEIIISDNASTDGTAEICKSYLSKDKRVRYYRNETNIGAAPNYRRVFELAQGEFFKWFACDDLCFRTFLSRCHAAIDSAPADVVLVYPLCEFIGESGQILPGPSDRIESMSERPHRRLARVIRRVSGGGPLWGLIRANYLRQTLLTSSVAYWDDLVLAELSLLGKILEIPEVLLQVRCYPGNAVAVASQGQGSTVVLNPFKANRKTRRNLLKWNDPSAADRWIWLSNNGERCWEYLKRVHHVPLPVVEKAMCYLTVPAVFYWTRFKTVGGAWRRKLGIPRVSIRHGARSEGAMK